jgi:hypothetical protein
MINVLYSCYQTKGHDSTKGKVLGSYTMMTYSNFVTGSHGTVETETVFQSYIYSVEYKESKWKIAQGVGKESWLFHEHLPGEIDENHTK